jgi:DNA recombination protein RmuC
MSFIIFGQAISTVQVLTGLVILLAIAVIVLFVRGKARAEDDAVAG